jgi:hypothetical protein
LISFSIGAPTRGLSSFLGSSFLLVLVLELLPPLLLHLLSLHHPTLQSSGTLKLLEFGLEP